MPYVAPLTDVLIADPGEADAIAADLDPLSTRDGVALKGVDPVKLARLEALATGRSLESVMARSLGSPLGTPGDDGPWVFAFPASLTAALAALDAEGLRALGARWAETEEFRLDRWPEPAVQDALRRLAAVARRAAEAGRPLLYRLAL